MRKFVVIHRGFWSSPRPSTKRCGLKTGALLIMMVLVWASTALALEINDKLSIGGILSGAYQHQNTSTEFDDFKNSGRGALSVQPEISFTPTDQDEVFVKLGFAAGTGLNGHTPFLLAPWAADLEDGVKNINGRDRDYLLTAWYKHTFLFAEDFTLALTGGIIDSTEYLDENAFANDGYTQFMNQAFVNGPVAFLTSFDTGGAVEFTYQGFSVKGVYMNVGKNDDGNNYNFYGVQLGHELSTALGKGNYRIIANHASEDFLDPAGELKKSRQAYLISFDQELGEIVGAWIRCSFQDDAAAIDHKNLYSGGLNISGKLWGRGQDNIGIGYALLDGGNKSVEKTQAAEGYVRFGLNEHIALSLHAQYMDDTYKPGLGTDVSGWIFGARTTVEF